MKGIPKEMLEVFRKFRKASEREELEAFLSGPCIPKDVLWYRMSVDYLKDRHKRNYARAFLATLTFDRKEKSFEDVKRTIEKGRDIHFVIRFFKTAPSIDYIIDILGYELAKKRWVEVKKFLEDIKDEPGGIYQQCEVFLE